MIRRSPCELYLKYLLVRYPAYTNEQVVELCAIQQVDVIGSHYLDQLRKILVVPVPFFPENKAHQPSFRFLIQHGLYQQYWPDLNMKAATRLLGKPRAKELIESMLIGKAPVGWIISALKRDGYSATSKVLEQYKAHYFDVDLVDSTELRATLRLRFQASAGSVDPSVLKAAIAYERAFKMDPRVSAAYSPIAGLSNIVNAMRVGIMPSNDGLSRILSSVRTLSAVRALEATMRDGYEDPMRASQYMMVANTAAQMLEATGSPEEDFQSKLSSIQLQNEEGDIPQLSDLSGGSHTTEIEIVGGQSVESDPGKASNSG